MEQKFKDQDTLLADDTRAFDNKLSMPSDNFDIDTIRSEKETLDRRYKRRLEELEEERKKEESLFRERESLLRNEDLYKEEVIKSQLIKLSDERSKREQFFNEKINEIGNELADNEFRYRQRVEQFEAAQEEKIRKQQERIALLEEERDNKIQNILDKIQLLKQEVTEVDEEYKEKASKLRAEFSQPDTLTLESQTLREDFDRTKRDYEIRLEEFKRERLEQSEIYRQREQVLQHQLEEYNNAIRQKVEGLRSLREEEFRSIDERVNMLLQEKMKCDELFNLRMEKIRREREFQNSEQNLRQQIDQQKRAYNEKLNEFDHTRSERETIFREESKPDIIGGLVSLSSMKDFKVAKGNYDVRGWDVIGSNNLRLGKVTELIVDPEQMKVRYLDIKVDNDVVNFADSRHLLIPIGVAILDEKDDNVLLPSLDGALISKIPEYTGETVTRDYENTLMTALSPDYNLHDKQDQFYSNQYFDDSKFYSKRRKED